MNKIIDQNFLTDTLQNLVKINSINPMLDPNSPGEKDISKYIASVLEKLNLNPTIEEIEKGRFNVTAVLRGNSDGKSLMMNAHMDTVGVTNMPDPFSAKISGRKLFGRGAYDMKGSIAAILASAKAIVDSNIKLSGDLVLAFVADEEYDSIGTEYLLKTITTDAAIVAEPSDLDICIAHRGFGLFEITTKGIAAHGGRPDKGIDANMQMGKFLFELNKISQKLKEQTPHPLLGNPSMHIPVINGGTEPFTYAAECKLTMERRTIPGDTFEAVIEEVESIITKLSSDDQTFNATVEKLMWRDPFETGRSSEIVKTLSRATKDVLKKESEYIGHTWWEDSALISKKGIDTVIIGPKGEGLHTTEEWVDLDSVVSLAEILFNTAKEYCK